VTARDPEDTPLLELRDVHADIGQHHILQGLARSGATPSPCFWAQRRRQDDDTRTVMG
jgi:hypothetical protein